MMRMGKSFRHKWVNAVPQEMKIDQQIVLFQKFIFGKNFTKAREIIFDFSFYVKCSFEHDMSSQK